jgi:hypothetical protein
MRHDAFGLMEWMAFNLADSGFVIMRSARKPTIAFDKTVNENPFLVVKEDEEDDRHTVVYVSKRITPGDKVKVNFGGFTSAEYLVINLNP